MISSLWQHLGSAIVVGILVGSLVGLVAAQFNASGVWVGIAAALLTIAVLRVAHSRRLMSKR